MDLDFLARLNPYFLVSYQVTIMTFIMTRCQALLYCTVLYRTASYCTSVHCTVLQCASNGLYSILLTVLYFTFFPGRVSLCDCSDEKSLSIGYRHQSSERRGSTISTLKTEIDFLHFREKETQGGEEDRVRPFNNF